MVDRIGRKIRVKCNSDDTIGDLKKLIAAQCGTAPEKIRLQKWYKTFHDHVTLDDCFDHFLFPSPSFPPQMRFMMAWA